ncbi:FkbM family methyltransferase [Fluviicola taffensis]|uniref:Methyltransferase FkbM family n=1 Tax=Fluviicola taffensis (strain DSM 16823 / NCIMB 13979 / RW262) TaxID=755732 RepID=F2II21_FLUTR|nr:FkbM family methyltransferase [Fluviicola taffensis]AEA42721.1 methyltransferase FkbM family [Fluviicola taffensis DSM 16823]
MKRLLKNKIAENLLIGIILLSNARNWVFKLVPSNNHYKPGTIRTVKRKGIWYQLDLSDYQEWLVYFYCKSDSSDYVLNYLQKSEAIFDIGANIGQTAFNMFTMQKAKKLKPIIYAFEPYPRTFSKLESNIILNKNNGIKAYNLGLSFKKGTLNMVQHSPSNSGGFRMTSNYSKDTISVPVTSLDDFIFEYQISFVDFIKIDVEGFELQVLKGAEETIKRFRPILIFEYSVQNIQVQGGDIEESLEKLKSLNYKISTKEGLSDLKSILSLDYQTDLICIPN